MTAPSVFADTETTDIGPRRLAWELAMIRREPDGTRKELTTFIEVDLSDASPFALSVGRFYERHPLGQWLAGGPIRYVSQLEMPMAPAQGYVTARDAALLWCRWTHGCHVVGAVPNFDTEVMGWAARSAGMIAGHHYHLADIENILVGYLRGKLATSTTLDDGERLRMERLATPPWKSDELFAEVGVSVPEDERHTALGDARGVERAWDVVMGGAS